MRIFKYSELGAIGKEYGELLQIGYDEADALMIAFEVVAGVMMEYDCRFTECRHGMGLAGGGGCPGAPDDVDCREFMADDGGE